MAHVTAAANGSETKPVVVLGISGSIAAYKSAEIARLLLRRGARVLPVMTRAAREMIGAVTLAGLTGERVHEEMFDASFPGELHVHLARLASAVLLAPATADLLARLATGRADDLMTAIALSTRAPIVAAPAMHPRMWDHPATRRNVATLAGDGRVALVGPIFGEVASGEEGVGRMADPAAIVDGLFAAIAPADLAGRHIVVTAGPTVEDLDPVRFLGNRSTGKMGFAIAERAAARGAKVTLVAGPVSLATPPGVGRVDVRSALEMREAMRVALGDDLAGASALVMTAAVADHRPADRSPVKRKRTAETMTIALVPNPDLLAEIGALRHARSGDRRLPVLVGFAVETASDEGVVAYARGKLERKGVDLVVANHAADSFGKDSNRATFVDAAGAEPLGVLSKHALADRILDRVVALVARSRS